LQYSFVRVGPASGPQQHGTADTIEAAKANVEDQWRVAEGGGLEDSSP